MISRRAATLFALLCLLAPAAQGMELVEPATWLPHWFLDLVEWIRDSLGSENPVNAKGNVGPYIDPTG